MLDAYWRPLYDLYTTLDNGKPSTNVSLHYRVNLQQYTGEDWTDAKLILSTSATDVLNAGIPEPDNLVVRPPTPPPVSDSYSMRTPEFSPVSCEGSMASYMEEEEEENDDMGFCLFGADDGAPPTPAAPAVLHKLVQSAATISKSPMAVSYTVEALTTIPSDGVAYKVLVATIPFEAVTAHITTPQKIPITYLQVMNLALLWVS